MTKVVISQPVFFGWPGFYQLIAHADKLVWLDDAQFPKGWYTHRARVSTSSGSHWLTIPLAKAPLDTSIMNMQVLLPFQEILSRKLFSYLGHLPFHHEANEIFSLACSRSRLVDISIASSELVLSKALSLNPETYTSSRLKVEGSSWKRVLKICKSLRATEYITGHGAKNYLLHEEFESNGISVRYIDYNVVPWREVSSRSSILDLIATVGLSGVSSYISSGLINWQDFLAS